MHGAAIGTVRAYREVTGVRELVFEITGEHGNQWQTARVNFVAEESYRVRWLDGWMDG